MLEGWWYRSTYYQIKYTGRFLTKGNGYFSTHKSPMDSKEIKLVKRESEWTPGVGDGQEGLACCGSWGRKESDTTERLNWTERKSTLNIHWKGWCWSSSTLTTWGKEPTHWKRPWCWERLKAGGERGRKVWGWLTWVWANSGRWWRTGKPGVL